MPRSCQLLKSSPGRMNASMKLRSKVNPSRLDMKTISLTPLSYVQSGLGIRSWTNREGNIRYVPGARSYWMHEFV